MYGEPIKVGNGAKGLIIAYWLKMAIITYVVAYHSFGFRLPTLPFDIGYVIQALQ